MHQTSPFCSKHGLLLWLWVAMLCLNITLSRVETQFDMQINILDSDSNTNLLEVFLYSIMLDSQKTVFTIYIYKRKTLQLPLASSSSAFNKLPPIAITDSPPNSAELHWIASTARDSGCSNYTGPTTASRSNGSICISD